MVAPGADWGEIASESSRKGLVEAGRSDRGAAGLTAGDRARFLKGLLEARLTGSCGEF